MPRRETSEDLETMVKQASVKVPRILTIDIETAPIEAYSWGPKWETTLIKVNQQSKIISYSAKWLNGKQVTKALSDYKGYRPGYHAIDDEKLVRECHALLDAADIVVTQNGVDFDLRTLNARFIKYGMSPPSPYKSIDTKKEARKYLRMPSHKLDDMGDYFGLGRKLEHEGFELWEKCFDGNKTAWSKMKRYNAQDVLLTEKVYLKLRPFMKNHPNLSSHFEGCVCPACGSQSLQARGYSRTVAAVFKRAQCGDCGHWSQYPTKERSFKSMRNAS